MVTFTMSPNGFLSRDPIGYEGSEWSLYEFVESMPLVKTDPKGLQGVILPPSNVPPAGTPCRERTNIPKPGFVPSKNGCTNPLTGDGAFVFTNSCNSHDVCYGTCGSDRAACDLQFYLDMVNHCQDVANNNHYGFCVIEAYTFYLAVRVAGFSYWDDAQDDACSWKNVPCPCPVYR